MHNICSGVTQLRRHSSLGLTRCHGNVASHSLVSWSRGPHWGKSVSMATSFDGSGKEWRRSRKRNGLALEKGTKSQTSMLVGRCQLLTQYRFYGDIIYNLQLFVLWCVNTLYKYRLLVYNLRWKFPLSLITTLWLTWLPVSTLLLILSVCYYALVIFCVSIITLLLIICLFPRFY